MIQANELRIGNWVQDHRGVKGIIKVSGISDNKVYDDNGAFDFADRHSGIELTPEILEKAGFEKLRDLQIWSKVIGNAETSSPTALSYNLPLGYMQMCRSGIAFIDTKLSYLHELQNLFFSLTGSELQISF